MTTDAITEFAPAKLNLCLHVTGRRPDGYHLLDSLVVFASVGDRVTVAPADALSLSVEGPEAAGLQAEADNLVLRAARATGVAGADLLLHKALPVASGIGGGSADAAATLRALARLSGRTPAAAELTALGADVPVCLSGRPVRMQGIGEVLTPLPKLPPLSCVLVNPRVALATPRVFATLERRENAPLPTLPVGWDDAGALCHWLASATRNDLAPPARALAPVIAEVEAALAALPGCLLARMSGSGATCFGLFARPDAAQAAARTIRQARPGWWVAAADILA